MEKVSIILPVYNSQDTIRNTIDTVLEQTYSNIELIIVDDGSVDLTSEICKKYATENTKVIYTRINNAGVSNARNTGIDLATGKYIMFIDADDGYKCDTVEKMVQSIEKTKCEMVCCNYNKAYSDGNIEKNEMLKEMHKEGKDIYLCIDYLHHKKCLKMLWNKIFLLNKIKDNKIKMDVKLTNGEDYKFIIEYLRSVKNIKIIEEYLYDYYIHGRSLSSNPEHHTLERRLQSLENHKKMYKDKNFPMHYINSQYIVACYAYIFNEFINKRNLTLNEKKSIINKTINNDRISKVLNEKYKKTFKIRMLELLIKKKCTSLILIISEIILKKKSKEKFYRSRSN